MKRRQEYIVLFLLFLLLVGTLQLKASAVDLALPEYFSSAFQQPDTTLPFPIKIENEAPFSNSTSPLYLDNPSNIDAEIVFDPATNTYVFQEKIGTWNYRTPHVMSVGEYQQYQYRKSVQEYWDLKSGGAVLDQPSFIPSITLGGEAFDKVFGSNTINIVPNGSAELIFGFIYSMIDNPNISERLQRTPSFQF
ncbi:MAG: hypothetical protein PF450_07955, partial [Bacteroidales bacterium]|nr:hypothetical protein [Bacteroidales bacterium]